MSLFPSPMMVRLQELKLWQGNYDSLLQNKSQNSTTANPSDCETIEGLSALDSIPSSPLSSPERKKTVDWDKKTISPPKPFEQLLEEKLAEDNPIQVQAKPKKPFLKKGSGLTRYRLNQQMNSTIKSIRKTSFEERLRSNQQNIKNKCGSAPVKRKSCLKKTNVPKEADINLTPLKMPDFEVKPKASWHKVLEQSKQNISHHDENVKEFDDFKTPKNYFNSHIMEKINEFALRHFLPHSSKKNINKHNSSPDSSDISPQNSPEKKTVEDSTTENELRIFEALEERVENSSFSSTNSSIVRLLSSTPNKIKKPLLKSPILEERKFISETVQNNVICNQTNVELHQKLHEINKKSDVLHDFLKNLRKIGGNDSKRQSTESIGSVSEKTLKQTPDTSFEDGEKWSSNTDTRSPTPTSCYTDFEVTCKGDCIERIDAAINTSFKDDDNVTILNEKCVHCEEIERKMDELQNNLPDIKAEKAKVMDFAKELEKKRDKITMEMQKLRRDYEDELSELRIELESERKKYARGKAVFDMYIKECQNRPTRREREEVSSLKKELTDIKELLKLKETKHGATQARLRNQIKQLEKDNSELKTEIEKLQKENSKLSANQKLQRRPSEMKMLHEINKNLSRLTEETFKKVSKFDNEGPSDIKEVKFGELSQEKENEDGLKIGKKGLQKAKKKQPCLKSKNNDIEENNSINDTCGHDITSFANLSLEKQYETVFGQLQLASPAPTNSSLNDSKKEKTETVFEDGSKEIRYSNGNTKTISPDGNLIIVKYYNGDIKETDLVHNTLKYYYAENGTWHTQFGDGLELLEYRNGQKERKYKDGKSEITCPDGSFVTRMSDGTEEILYRDGSKLIKNLAGDRILLLPNGQKEIHTQEHKRREYPDGTVKILYPDGTQETRYASGRVRVKDSSGTLIMDSQNSE